MSVYFEHYTEHIHTLSEIKHFVLNQVVHIVTTLLYRLNHVM